MGQDPSRTVSEIALIRDRLDDELDALAATLPPVDVLVRRAVLAAAAGALVVLGLWYAGHRARLGRQERRVKRLVREAIAEHEAGDRGGRS